MKTGKRLLYGIIIGIVGFGGFLTIFFNLPTFYYGIFLLNIIILLCGYYSSIIFLSKIQKYINELASGMIFSETQYQKIFSNSKIAIMKVNKKELIISWNDYAEKLLHKTSKDLYLKPVENIYPPEEWLKIREYKIREKKGIQQYETKIYSKNNKILTVDMSINVLKNNNGEVIGSIGIFKDITTRKNFQTTIEYNSFHDPLTGLYNRRYYKEELKRISNLRSCPLSIIVMDVNKLKIFNDTLGHAAGDVLLIKAGEYIKKYTRKEDLTARIGGDEFIILLKNTKYTEAYKKAILINEKFKKEKIKNISTAGFAIGISTYEKDSKSSLEKFIIKADEELYKNKMENSQTVQGELVMSLIKIMEQKDQYIEAHELRMKTLAEDFGILLNMTSAEIQELKWLAMFHDIGKICIPDNILNKKEPLNDKEWTIMKNHSCIGFNILSPAKQFSSIALYVLHHHEHFDGTGYPHNLKGEKIPYLSRIITILDTFDTMISGRGYQSSVSIDIALKEIKKCSNTQFDPYLAKKFIELIRYKQNKQMKQFILLPKTIKRDLKDEISNIKMKCNQVKEKYCEKLYN